ncbi:MAG: tannase/feruloyl esterase family alpha/beta hydrolase [Gammaproteobacteria bacterium]|nr:tannase/feruloyl esterase family alpha/beta hydrolase [Gammaproteobacteria bacterium]
MNSIKSILVTSGILLVACSESPMEENLPNDENVTTASMPMSCEDLAEISFPNTVLTSVETIPAGEFEAPTGGFPGFGPDYSVLPSFCRVVGSIEPTSDSDIRFEVWLPQENWNGRFMQTGNGGAAGSIVHSSLVNPLMRGYAVANTDTGHQNGGRMFGWAAEYPEKLTDFAWRAVHELTVVGKAITETHYGSRPELSYFVGCSTGGRQGLMEAQRFPYDYDAVVAGAPANNWSSLMALSIVIQTNMGKGKLALNKVSLLKEAAIASCDALDGVEDRVITSIGQCSFDPADLQCAGELTAQCLSEEEVAAAQAMYAGVVDSEGQVWIPGTGPASEPLWAGYTNPGFMIGTNFFQDVVFEEKSWDPYSFDADNDMPAAADAGIDIIAMDPDLSDFFGHGGKLITYHGTTDGLIPYSNTLNYFNSVLKTVGEDAVNESARFYLVHGMDHCAGGNGAHAIDWLSALESWVEEGQAPGVITGTHPAPPPGFPGSENAQQFTRPICPYPEVTTYDGVGDPTLAENFSCQEN